MSRNPILSPTYADNDVVILEGVLHGVLEEGARYGLTHRRRDLLAFTLQVLVQSLREGWEDQFRAAVTTAFRSQTGRPSHPEGRDGGDAHLSDPTPKLTG